MGVVRHPGSIGVRRGPDRSIGGQGPVDLSVDARNPESVMDQELLGAALSQRDDKSVEPYFGWGQPGADFLGGILSPDPVAYGWDAVDGSLSQYRPGEGAPPVNPLVLQRLQAELPWGKLRSGAQSMGRLGSAAARPVVRMNPRNVDDWVEARRLNVQPSDSADFYFRTERPQLGNLRITPSEVPAGSRYYRDPEGLVSRFKTKETAAQTLKPDQHGWIDPGRYRFLDEAAADLVARQIREPSRALARFEWGGGQLRVVDVVSGRPVGVVSDVPRVGFSPFGNWSDGRTHLGDRIVELGKGV